MRRSFLPTLLLAFASMTAHAQSWTIDTRGASGPLVQIALPYQGGKARTAFIALEYARNCDPIFSFAEISGAKIGSPVSQTTLNGTKIGIVLNGNFHTWHAAKTTYTNGYEVGLGITNDLALQLLINVQTIYFLTPEGERIQLQAAGLSKALQAGIEYCKQRIR